MQPFSAAKTSKFNVFNYTTDVAERSEASLNYLTDVAERSEASSNYSTDVAERSEASSNNERELKNALQISTQSRIRPRLQNHGWQNVCN